MRKSRAVVCTALVSGAALVLAACSTAEPSTTTSSSAGAVATTAGGGGSTSSETGTTGGAAAGSSGSTLPGNDGLFTRPKVESSPNVTIAEEENVHDYNNNTGTANNSANAPMTALVQPSPFLEGPDLLLSIDGDVMTSVKETSTSPQTVVYKINPKASWSDGSPVACKDFYLAWLAGVSKAKSKDGLAFDPVQVTGYDQMNAPACSDNGKTITTVYTTPYADWRGLFGPLVPAHVIEKDSGVADVTKLKASDTTGDVVKFAASYIKNFAGFNPAFDLSAGPYMLKSLTDEQVVLARNPQWWGNPAGPESLTLVTNSNGQAEVQSLQNQEVQVLNQQPDAALATQLKALPNVKFSATPGATYEHIDFNMTKKLFQGATGLALRQAFFNCVDRTDMIKKLVAAVNDQTKPLGNVIFIPTETAYKDDWADYLTANVPKAKSIMEAAGWKLGPDGVYALPDGTKAEFKLGHKVIDTREKVSQLINGQCIKAGIKVDDDQTADFNSKRLPAHDFDTALFAWVGTPYKSGGYANYTTGGGGNYNQMSDPTVDKLFKESNIELDNAKRTAINQELDTAIAKTFTTLPTYQFSDMISQATTLTPTQTWVGPFGSSLWNAWEWVYKP